VTVVTSARLPYRCVTADMFFAVVGWCSGENGCRSAGTQEPSEGLWTPSSDSFAPKEQTCLFSVNALY